MLELFFLSLCVFYMPSAAEIDFTAFEYYVQLSCDEEG